MNVENFTYLNRPFVRLWPREQGSGHCRQVSAAMCACVFLGWAFVFLLCWNVANNHCCVPRCSNRGRTGPSLFFHSFPLSRQHRKRWLVAIHRDERSNFCVPSTTVCSEPILPPDFQFYARAWESVDSLITGSIKLRKANLFPKACAMPSVFSFHSHVFLHRLPSELTKQVGALREHMQQSTPAVVLGQMVTPLTIGSWQKARWGLLCMWSLCYMQAFFRLHLEEHRRCMWGDDVEILTVQETRLSCLFICGLLFLSSTLSNKRCSN